MVASFRFSAVTVDVFRSWKFVRSYVLFESFMFLAN